MLPLQNAKDDLTQVRVDCVFVKKIVAKGSERMVEDRKHALLTAGREIKILRL